MESGPLLPCGDCVPGRAGTLGDVPATASVAPDWSARIVTVRIFFGPGAAGTPGMADVAVETVGAAGGGEAGLALGAGFEAVAVVIAGAVGACDAVDIAGLLDVGPAE